MWNNLQKKSCLSLVVIETGSRKFAQTILESTYMDTFRCADYSSSSLRKRAFPLVIAIFSCVARSTMALRLLDDTL